MSLFGFIILLIIAGFSRGGCLIAAIVGFIGAFLGMWLAQQLGLPEVLPITIDGETFPVLWSIIGSALFSAILSLLSGRRGRRTA